MKKIFNYSFFVVFLICSISICYFMFNLSEVTAGQLLSLMGMSIVGFVFYKMTENGASKETENKGFVTLLLLAVCFIIILFASSCSRYVTVDQAANGKAKCGKWLK